MICWENTGSHCFIIALISARDLLGDDFPYFFKWYLVLLMLSSMPFWVASYSESSMTGLYFFKTARDCVFRIADVVIVITSIQIYKDCLLYMRSCHDSNFSNYCTVPGLHMQKTWKAGIKIHLIT